MKGTSHAIIGATTGYVLSGIIGSDLITTIGITTIGSIIVDIDEEHSTINKLLFPVGVKYRNYLKILIGLIMLLVPNTLCKYLGAIITLSAISSKVVYQFSLFGGFQKREYHRTIFHNPIIGGLILILPLYMLDVSYNYRIAFIVGIYIGHYLMDSFTTYGLPLFPLKRCIRMPIYFSSRNNIAEKFVVVSFIGVAIAFTNPHLIESVINFIK
ncbi:metal-dependent hydrolase [Senegalia massiliensis]|nr:metal-dependent hydrolase [Senegalia massiliensis]